VEKRFDRIDAKLDAIDAHLNAMKVEYEKRTTKLETTQKGFVALCVALITAALGTLGKILHL
jgi:hypothetical protein